MQVHDVVAVTRDVVDSGLVKGQVGTIVEQWREGVYEVEFADLDGRAYAMVALPEDVLLPLWFQPVRKAA
jgi:hypothetical protein